MKTLILSLFMFLAAMPAFAAEGAKESAYDRVMRTGVLRCGYFIWPPYFDKDPNTGAFSGIYYDIVNAVGKTLNLKVEWTLEYALGTQVESLRTGKVDALCADGPWTRSAMPYLDYSHGYMFIPGYVYVAEGNPKALDYAKLNSPDITFTAIDGDGSQDYFDTMFARAKILSLPATADPGLLIKNLVGGKADAMFNDPMTVKAYTDNNPEKPFALNPGRPLAVYPFAISVSKNEQGLLNMLNQGIDLVNNMGLIDAILLKYDPSGELVFPAQKPYRHLKE